MDKKVLVITAIAFLFGFISGYMVKGDVGIGFPDRQAAVGKVGNVAPTPPKKPEKNEKSSLPAELSFGNLSAQNISKNPGSSIYPKVVKDSYGTLYAAWVEKNPGKYEINMKMKKPGSMEWENVDTGGLYEGKIFSVDMAVDSKGVIHTAFRGKTEGEEDGYYAYYAKRGAEGWSKPENLSDGLDNVYAPLLLLDKDDNIHVTWNVYFGHNAAVYYMRNEGGKWGERELLSPKKNASDWLPSLFVDKNGGVHIVYHHSATVEGVEYRKRGKDGKWSEPVNIASGTKFPALGRVVMDGKGALHAFFLANAGSGEDIFYTSRENGKWTKAAAITTTGKRSNVEKVLLDSKGRLHLFWNELIGDDNHDIYYIRGENGIWSEVVKLVETEADSLGYDIVLTDNDKIGLVWQEGTRRDSDIFYTEIGNGGN